MAKVTRAFDQTGALPGAGDGWDARCARRRTARGGSRAARHVRESFCGLAEGRSALRVGAEAQGEEQQKQDNQSRQNGVTKRRDENE